MDPQTPGYSTPPRRSQAAESLDISRSLSELSVTGRPTCNLFRNHPSSPTRYPLGAMWNEDEDEEDDEDDGDEEDEEVATEDAAELDPDAVDTITLENIADYHGILPEDEEDENLEAGPSGYLQGWAGNGVQSEMVAVLFEIAAQTSSTHTRFNPEPAPAEEMGVVSLMEDHSDYEVGVDPNPDLPISDTTVTSTHEFTIISHDNPFLDDDNSDNDVVDTREFNEDELEPYGFQSDDDIDADWQDTNNDDDQPSVVDPSLVITDATTTAAAVFGPLYLSLRAFSRDEMTQRCQAVFEVEPKDEQLQVTEHIGQGKDCILIAGCGWGKTIAFFLPLALWEDRTILVISPLKALMQDQREKLEAKNITCTTLSSNQNVPRNIVQQLAKGKYRAVFLTPEFIFKSDRLKELWHLDGWRCRLMAVVIDEAHFIESWGGEFRTSYGDLGRLRSKVRAGVAFVALSATLPNDTLEKIRKSLHCKQGTVIHAGTDRPNLFYEVRYFKNFCSKGREFKDLLFILDFKKTIVYFDSTNTLDSAHKYLSRRIPLAHRHLIQPFHSTNSAHHLQEALPLLRNNRIRVLLATEAAGMGCDVSDIERVVQYLAPGNLITLAQRVGRAARDPSMKGEGILLVHNPDGRSKDQAKDKDLNEFIKAKGCLRKILNLKFGDKHVPSSDLSKCCTNCRSQAHKAAPELKFVKKEFSTARSTAEQKEQVWEDILHWRRTTFGRQRLTKLFFVDEHHILPDPSVVKLKENFDKITTIEDIHSQIKWTPLDNSWPGELLGRLLKLRETFKGALVTNVKGASTEQKGRKRPFGTESSQQQQQNTTQHQQKVTTQHRKEMKFVMWGEPRKKARQNNEQKQ